MQKKVHSPGIDGLDAREAETKEILAVCGRIPCNWCEDDAYSDSLRVIKSGAFEPKIYYCSGTSAETGGRQFVGLANFRRL